MKKVVSILGDPYHPHEPLVQFIQTILKGQWNGGIRQRVGRQA